MRIRHGLIFFALAVASVAIYVGLSSLGGSIGFPLDDAWIHQTYARSLAESGQLAYAPGQPSAGSTSPLWTLLIAAGYKLSVDYRLWTYALGAVSLALCALGVERLSLRLWPGRPRLAFAAGVLCACEWHLAWAAASGMETLLFAALALALMERSARTGLDGRGGAILGVWGGLLTVTRPEGLLLFGMAGLVALFRNAESSPDRALRPHSVSLRALAIAGGFVVPVLPAVWLNLQASGTPFPNTFYAKQQEYAAYFASLAAWLPRALDVVTAPFVGAQVLLAPGVLLGTWESLRRRRDRSTWPRLLLPMWIGVHLAVYAARLPVTYQHGRYLMPIVPAIVLWGLHGSAGLLERARRFGVLRRAGIGSLIAATAAFWLIGAGAYRADVNVIERELVASARWIEAHTPPDALIAAHDIGAVGYFARRPLLDLAGLVAPEVIPIIRDEEKLLALLRERSAAYLAAPPGFYTTLLDAPELQPVFAGDSPFAPEHWRVFRARWQ